MEFRKGHRDNDPICYCPHTANYPDPFTALLLKQSQGMCWCSWSRVTIAPREWPETGVSTVPHQGLTGKGKHGKSWDWHMEENQNKGWPLGFLVLESFLIKQEGSSNLTGLRNSSSNLIFQVYTVKNTINLVVLWICCVLITKQNWTA